MRNLAIIAAVTAALSTPVIAKEPVLQMGAGYTTCGQYAKNYKSIGKVADFAYFEWAQGFMSAVNLARIYNHAETKDLNSMPVENQWRWLRSYCDKHPLAEYYEGVKELFDNLASVPPAQDAESDNINPR
jgi:hypothetical protein